MNLRALFFFLIPSLIWGSTWYVIKFQIGSTDPMLSVGFRFLIAGIIILLFCIVTRKSLKFPFRSHLFIALQGFSLFGFNYWFVYMAEIHLTSALVAVVFSTLVFMNIFLNRLVLKAKIDSKVVFASALGFSGVMLLFRNELHLNFNEHTFLAIIFCLASVFLASLGNILSAFNQKNKIPLIQTNGLGMVYGAATMIIVALISGKSFVIDTQLSYQVSLFYLALFGSVIAFSVYLKMLGEIGPDKAGYVILVVPLVALAISTAFEDYRWNLYSVSGALLLVIGNVITLRNSRKVKEVSS